MSDQNHAEDGPVRPQVIDLQAEEIRTEPDAPSSAADEAARETAREESIEPPPPPPPPPPPKRRRSGTAAWIIAALILGALGGGWLYRDVLSSYLPSNEMVALKNQVAALEQNNSALGQQVDAVKQATAQAAQAASAAGDAAQQAANGSQGLSGKIDELGSRLEQTDKRIAASEAQLKQARADLDAFRKSLSAQPAPAQGANGGAVTPVDNAALAALGQRIDALEKDVASLKSAAGANPQAGITAALSQALADLKAKVAAGTSYQAEYDRIARMVPAAAGLDVVAAHAAEGVPDAKGLAKQLRDAIPSLPQPAALPPEDNSYFGTFMKSLSGVISVRPIGETDWPQVAEKAAAFADSGDLTQAIAVIQSAEGEKPMALSQWSDRAAQRLKLEAAISQVSEAVLRQIAALGGGGTQ